MVLFWYVYCMCVQGDKVVILDLYNVDYYYYVFIYFDF